MKSEEKSNRARIEEMAMHDIFLYRVLQMHRHGESWTECMEVAVIALVEQKDAFTNELSGQMADRREAKLEFIENENKSLRGHVELLRDSLLYCKLSMEDYPIDEHEREKIDGVLDETPTQALAAIRSKEVEAMEAFKDELLRSVSVIYRPHIEGVCSIVAERLKNGDNNG